NHGPRTATNATIVIPIPSNATFDSSEPILGVRDVARVGGSIVARLMDLPSGSTARFAITLRPLAEGELGVSASVRCDQYDNRAVNNTVTLSLPVENRPGSLQFRQSVVTADEGGQVVVTV